MKHKFNPQNTPSGHIHHRPFDGAHLCLRHWRRGRRSIRLKGFDYSSEGAYYVTIVAQGRECLFGKIIDGEMHLSKYGKIVHKWWDEIPVHFPNVELGTFVIMPNHVHGIIFIIEDRRGEALSPRDLPNSNRRGEVLSPHDHPNSNRRGEVISPRERPNTNRRGEVLSPRERPNTNRRGEVLSPHDHPNSNNQENVNDIDIHLQENESMNQGGETENQGVNTQDQGGETPPLRKPTLGQIVAYFKYQSTKEMNKIETENAITKFWQRNYYEHIIRNEKELQQKTDYIMDNPSRWEKDDENPVKR